MDLVIGIRQIIILIGSFNCLFLGIIFTGRSRADKKADYLLAVLFILLSWGFFYTFYITSGLYVSFPHFLLVGAPNTFAFGPLVLLYTRSLVRATTFFGRSTIVHFAPFILHTLSLMPYYFSDVKVKISDVADLMDYGSPFFFVVYLQVLHLAVYLLLCLKDLRAHTVNIRASFSYTDRINLAWLQRFIIACITGLACYVALLVYRLRGGAVPGFLNEYNDLVLIVLIHILAYLSFVQRDIFTDGGPVTAARKYERSSLTVNRAAELERKLILHMKERRPHLESELNLQKLAEDLGVIPNHLSQVINQRLGMNFFEFINRYRVEEARRIMDDASGYGKKIIEIAFDSGFKSKSAFNAVFREYTGLTPSEYRKRITRLAS